MSDKVEDFETKIRQESAYVELKMRKSRSKAGYTNARNRLRDTLLNDGVNRDLAREHLGEVEENMDRAVSAVHDLVRHFSTSNKSKEMNQVLKEIDTIENQYDKSVELLDVVDY